MELPVGRRGPRQHPLVLFWLRAYAKDLGVGRGQQVLNLFIAVVVNAMQEEASKADAEEREVEREMIQEEAAPILAEVRSLRTEVAQLRTELAGWRTQASS